MEKQKKIVVFSAVNFISGGPLTIYKDAVQAFVAEYMEEYKLVLLVNNKNLFANISSDDLQIREYSYPKKSWLLRMWFEYVHCYFISKKIKPYLWLSLHDMTPNVQAVKKAVYCHNPAPFYKLSLNELIKEKSLFLFHFLYSLMYRLNIKSNNYVIVQQQWLREEFKKRYKVNNVIVAYPDIEFSHVPMPVKQDTSIVTFFYPALPRSFKNFEVLLDAAVLLSDSHSNFEVIVTFNGSENKIAAELKAKYSNYPFLKFAGLQSRESMQLLYRQCSFLVFPSKMETWGLPISEAKFFNKPMLVAKRKYALETVGNYDKVCFFDDTDTQALSNLLAKAMDGSLKFQSVSYPVPESPFVKSRKELFFLLLKKND